MNSTLSSRKIRSSGSTTTREGDGPEHPLSALRQCDLRASVEPQLRRPHPDHGRRAGRCGTRGGYYDHSGVVRDMIQNHLIQLLTLMTMEPPVAYNARALRDEKVKVLQAVSSAKLMDCVWGQYRGYRTSLE